MWIDQHGTETEDPNDFAAAIGKACLKAVGTTGGCTFSKTINNMSVSDFQARPVWYANYAEPQLIDSGEADEE